MAFDSINTQTGWIDGWGDDRGWEHFERVYLPMMFSWIKFVAKPLGIPEDEWDGLVLDLYLKLRTQQKIKAYKRKQGHRFRGWLRTVLQNMAYDWLRQEKRRKRYSIQDVDELDQHGRKFWERDAAYLEIVNMLGWPTIREELDAAGKQFAQIEWEAFRLRTYEGRAGAEAAQLVAKSEAWVSATCKKIREAIRETLEDEWSV